MLDLISILFHRHYFIINFIVYFQNGWTALTDAAYFCQPEAVKELLKKHCDVNLRNVVSSLFYL